MMEWVFPLTPLEDRELYTMGARVDVSGKKGSWVWLGIDMLHEDRSFVYPALDDVSMRSEILSVPSSSVRLSLIEQGRAVDASVDRLKRVLARRCDVTFRETDGVRFCRVSVMDDKPDGTAIARALPLWQLFGLRSWVITFGPPRSRGIDIAVEDLDLLSEGEHSDLLALSHCARAVLSLPAGSVIRGRPGRVA
jgi:hypothetical protein